MDAKSWIFEERKITLQRGAFKDYIGLCKENLWPESEKRGARVLCLLSGQMGESPQELVQMTRFPDMVTWQDSQPILAQRDSALIVKEDVRLMRSIVDSRPKNPLPIEEHQPVYGYRRFFIKPDDLEEVAHLSEDGVWPLFESLDCHILGLWTPVAITASQEVLLISGYRSLAHWEETRLNQPMPEGFDTDLLERGREAALRRHGLTHWSWVSMMRAIHLEGQS